MTNLSHENQYAKPSKQIFSIANLLRDLWWDASDSKIDAYFVSLDFKKAFDSIDQALAFSSPSQNEFPHEIHPHSKFIEQGRQCSRPCQSFLNWEGSNQQRCPTGRST